MTLFDEKMSRYLSELARPEDPVLREMEALAVERRFPIVGPEVGRLIYVLAASMGARRVLELGSGFGYSAVWFARAVGASGLVMLTDRSSERLTEAQGFLARAGLGSRIHTEAVDALEVLGRDHDPFDIIFNDIDKQHYPRILEGVRRHLRPGGLLISDNMLWSGRVIEPAPDDAATRGVVELTRALYGADDFVTALMPVRDGVTVSVRL